MMNGHHLIMGELIDYLTGNLFPDTHDERYRQKVARLLIEEKGYFREEIESRYRLFLSVDDKRGVIPIDFHVILSGKICMVIKYGPGSLVTRRRVALASSRLLSSYQIPIAVVTNGEDAEILDALRGNVLKEGLDSIPRRMDLIEIASAFDFPPISRDRFEMESRIMYAMEVDGSCPCDDTICRF
ncbi:MAG: type I restriction enzyme HsdR N-terminal domain-containing protein [Thermodesulfobacteriota bacterium]